MKILVIEDDADIVESIAIALDLSYPGATYTSTHLGEKGLELVENECPDVVLLDIGLPDLGGFEVLKQLRAFSEVPILVITARQNEADVIKGLNLGADDYIGKPFGQLELIARIKTVLRRTGASNDENLFFNKLRLDATRCQLLSEDRSVKLTPTENRIMQALMRQPGKVRTFADLAEEIWGGDYPGANDAIRVYVRRLRTKVELIAEGCVHINSQARVGFVLEP